VPRTVTVAKRVFACWFLAQDISIFFSLRLFALRSVFCFRRLVSDPCIYVFSFRYQPSFLIYPENCDRVTGTGHDREAGIGLLVTDTIVMVSAMCLILRAVQSTVPIERVTGSYLDRDPSTNDLQSKLGASGFFFLLPQYLGLLFTNVTRGHYL
jgi:hypothetical protein